MIYQRIALTNGDAVFTRDPIDFDALGGARWLTVEEVRRAIDGTVRDDLPTKTVHINIAQIVNIKEVEW